MIVDCISDLHGHYPKLEGGDLLIVAGDLTATDNAFEYADILEYLTSLDYKKVILIAGNHDNKIESFTELYSNRNLIYLSDSGTEFEGLKIWGTPWTKTFEGMNPHCKAFTCDTEEELARKFSLIPEDIDILISHGPTKLMHDETVEGINAGSSSLLKYVAHDLKNLKLFVCGHIHEAYGIWDQRKIQKKFNDKEGPVFINCSHVNEHYQPVNKPIRVII